MITQIPAKIKTEKVEIILDSGVFAIFAPTDEEADYALTWAIAEDDFQSILEYFLAVRVKLCEIKGKDGAIMDFLAAFDGSRANPTS